jgi:hypothetical protein
MVFSSHRFRQLTRHADQILYVAYLPFRTWLNVDCDRCMTNSTVQELGTHEEWLRLAGGHSKIYNIQAAQFK